MLKLLLDRIRSGPSRKPQIETQDAISFWYPNPRSGVENIVVCDWRIAGDYLIGLEPVTSRRRDFYIPSISRPDYALAKALLHHPKARRSVTEAQKAGRTRDPSRLP